MAVVRALDSPPALSGDFTNSQAADIERAYTDGKVRLLGMFAPMGVVLFVVFMPWDYAMSPEAARITIPIRFLLSFLLISLWLARATEFVRGWYDWLVGGLLAISGLGIATILTLIPGGFSTASGGIAIVIMFGAGAVRMPARLTIAVFATICIGTALCMYAMDEPPTMVFSTMLMLTSFSVLGVLYNAASRRDAVHILTSQSRLRTEKEQSDALLRQITTMRAERLTWLENLARFLRHELKNQMVAMGTSIELAQGGDSLDANRIYLDRAQRSLGRMRGLVSSATEATSLEAALTMDAVAQVDLSALVAERVLAFQQVHPSKQLVLRPKPGLVVSGNEERLTQLLDKLLNNAAEHSEPDAEIRVAIRRVEDAQIELSVENEGDALPEDKERMFEAFVSSRSQPENLGIGLYVARSVARNHGGEVVAEDLPGARGARFVVRLPETGQGAAKSAEPEPMQRAEPLRLASEPRIITDE